MPKWIIAIVVLVCVVARPGWSAEWERIAEEEARIVFYPPGLSSGEFRKRGQIYFNEEWAMWRGFGGMPRAEVYLQMLFPGRYYNREWKLEAITHNWGFFDDKKLEISNKNRRSTRLGSIRYQQFVVEDLHCVAFLHGWGPTGGSDTGEIGEPPHHINGYYCDRSALSKDTVKAVLSGIGVRGHRVPPKPEASTERESILQNRAQVLPPNAQRGFDEYLSSPKYGDFKAFAVDRIRGRWGRSWGYYDPNAAIHRALELCRERSQECILWAVGNTVVARISPEQVEAATALASWENALGPDHTDVAMTLNTVAERQRTQENYAEAEPLYILALAILEKALKPERLHDRWLATSMATILENHAALLRDTGRTSEATKMESRAKAIRAKIKERITAGSSGRFDGQWEGFMSCGSCENCLGPIKESVSIDVKNSKFDLIPDPNYKGVGVIDDAGNVSIVWRPDNYGWGNQLRKNFRFVGKHERESFVLSGERGPRSCDITLSRVNSPED